LAREAFPDGPGLDVSLADMEDIVAVATQAVVKGSLETMTDQQAESLGEHADCPTCGTRCELKRKTRDVTVRGGEASLEEPVAHCRRCRRDFFPSA
jgi:anaerobic selenocysteine-containing dehydrogenase